MKTFSVVVSGASGRVGRALCARVESSPAHRLAGALASSASTGKPVLQRADVVFNGDCAPPVDAVIDFSTDEGCQRALETALSHRAPIVVATTALSDATIRALHDASARIPVMIAPNTSLGAALTTALASVASRSLGSTYDISLVESHRAGKRDAPSGTAIWIADSMRKIGATVNESQIFSIRGGDTVGEHVVRFSGAGEIVELTHRVASRDVFAIGALRAAEWMHGKAPGHYVITDVLGLNVQS